MRRVGGYRAKVEELRQQAERARSPIIKRGYLELALEYEELADAIERENKRKKA